MNATGQRLAVSDSSIERRRAPRFERRLAVRIGDHTAVCTNFSLTGMQLTLPPDTSEVVARALDDAGHLLIEISLPADASVQVRCRLAYLSQCDEECLAGLDFGEFLAEDQRSWSSFVGLHEPGRVH